MSPLPIALCGKNPTLASHFVKTMDEGSKYQVVTVFHSTQAATSELSQLLSGNTSTKPSSGIGSNASSSTSIAPQAIVAGAGFSEDEVETMRRDIPGAKQLAWLHPTKGQAQRPGQAGFIEGVVGRAKQALDQHATKAGGVESGMFGF